MNTTPTRTRVRTSTLSGILCLIVAGLLPAARPAASQDFGTHTVRYAHDSAARLTQFTVANAAMTIRYDWEAGGLLSSRVTGETMTVDSEDMTNALPTRFALRAAYPNPFKDRITLPYDLPEDSQVRLELYDILGRRVATVADSRRPAGFHTVEWTATGFGSGIYVARLTAGRKQFTTTLVKF